MKKYEQRPPPYRLFFTPLVVELSPEQIERIQFAYFVSKYGHAKQRRDDGSRYFDHPKAVAWIYVSELEGRDSRIIIDMLLHDIIEDTYLLSPYRVSRNFGKEIALDVSAMTKLPDGKETTKEYLERCVVRGPHTILSKLCDRLHNHRDAKGCTEEKQKRKIVETKEYHIPILLPELQKYGKEWEKYAEILNEKLTDAM